MRLKKEEVASDKKGEVRVAQKEERSKLLKRRGRLTKKEGGYELQKRGHGRGIKRRAKLA